MPISNVFDTGDTKLLTLKVQGAILAVDVFLIGQGIKNIYLLISILTVVVLFVLQLINKRFLLLFPAFQWVDRKSKSIDTYLLYILLFLSLVFTLLGIFDDEIYIIWSYECFVKSYVLPVILVPSIFIILIYFRWRKCLVRNLLTKKIKKSLKKEPFEEPITSLCEHCGSSEALMKRTIDRWDLGVQEIVCSKCEKQLSYENVKLQLGEVNLGEAKIEEETITVHIPQDEEKPIKPQDIVISIKKKSK